MYNFLHYIVKQRLLFSLVLTFVVGASPAVHLAAPSLGMSPLTVHAQETSEVPQAHAEELPEPTINDEALSFKVYLPSTIGGSVAPEQISHLAPTPSMQEDPSMVANAAGWSTTASRASIQFKWCTKRWCR